MGLYLVENNDKELIKSLLHMIQSPHLNELLKKYNDVEDMLYDHLNKKYAKTNYGITLVRETVRRILYSRATGISFYDEAEHILYYIKFLISNLSREHFYTISLNKKGYMINDILHSTGTIDRVSVYPREILTTFINTERPYGIIAAHNHPSGNPTPSQEDIEVTKQIEHVLNIYKVHLIEHVVVSRKGFVMMKQDGYLN